MWNRASHLWCDASLTTLLSSIFSVLTSHFRASEHQIVGKKNLPEFASYINLLSHQQSNGLSKTRELLSFT